MYGVIGKSYHILLSIRTILTTSLLLSSSQTCGFLEKEQLRLQQRNRFLCFNRALFEPLDNVSPCNHANSCAKYLTQNTATAEQDPVNVTKC